jgi:hypothetical protein
MTEALRPRRCFQFGLWMAIGLMAVAAIACWWFATPSLQPGMITERQAARIKAGMMRQKVMATIAHPKGFTPESFSHPIWVCDLPHDDDAEPQTFYLEIDKVTDRTKHPRIVDGI